MIPKVLAISGLVMTVPNSGSSKVINAMLSVNKPSNTDYTSMAGGPIYSFILNIDDK